jgi:hypothetical protein
MESPGFSSFRALMDTWDQSLEEERVKKSIDNLLDNQNFIMFFKKGKEVFGTGEDGRVIFAKIKHPDEETPAGWEKDANFSAVNLNKAAQGDPAQHVFDYKDMKIIKVIDRDKAAKILEKVANNLGEKAFPSQQRFKILDIGKMFPKDRNFAPNFIQAKEKS